MIFFKIIKTASIPQGIYIHPSKFIIHQSVPLTGVRRWKLRKNDGKNLRYGANVQLLLRSHFTYNAAV